MSIFLFVAASLAVAVGLHYYTKSKGTTTLELVKSAVARGISALVRPK